MLSHFSRARLSATLWPVRALCPWDSPGKDTGVGCLQAEWPLPRKTGSHRGLVKFTGKDRGMGQKYLPLHSRFSALRTLGSWE